jgi:glucose uptake protein GlcU
VDALSHSRGKIGLLIVQVGYNSTSYVMNTAFYIAAWAILLNTIVGPIMVGLLIKSKAGSIARSPWGTRGAEKHEG